VARSAEFPTWPASVQEKVAAGQIDIGFTAEQVWVALGNPDTTLSRETADGVSEVWGYRERRPPFGFGIGVGVGSIGRSGGVSTGVGVGTGVGGGADEKVRVVFDRSGRVSAIEETRR
jgi:hypothetical protein